MWFLLLLFLVLPALAQPQGPGQIVYVAKHHRGSSWRTLSIPVGRSAEFNRSPTRYVSPA